MRYFLSFFALYHIANKKIVKSLPQAHFYIKKVILLPKATGLLSFNFKAY